MRTLLACLGLMGMIILSVSCTSPLLTPTITPQPHRLLATSAEKRVSDAPAGTVTLHLNQPGYERGVDFLLTLSNSTAGSIQIPLVKGDDCYRNAFWFYMKTGTGWHPMMPALSARCLYSLPGESIPSGLEEILNLRTIARNRLLGDQGLATYMLRVKYMNSEGQEFSLYTDEFNQGAPEPIDEFGITVEPASSDAVEWKVMKHSIRLIWLAPLCSSSRLGGGTIDEEHSTLQRLTEAGSWSIVPVACKQASTIIKIQPDETVVIDGRQWLENAGLSLPPGQYRWDLVLFLQWVEGGQRTLADGRHIFSQIFSISD